MPRAGDGKPFGDALNNAEDNRYKQIIKHVFPFRKPRNQRLFVFMSICLFMNVFLIIDLKKTQCENIKNTEKEVPSHR